MGQAGRLCLTIFVVCIAVHSAKAAALVETPPKNTVLKFGEATKKQILPCTLVENPDPFTNFKWERHADTPICDAPTNGDLCGSLPQDTIYEMSLTKYDLLAKDKIDYTHAGDYKCSLTVTSPASEEQYHASVTVAGTTTCSENKVIFVGDSMEIKCTIEYQGGLPPTLTITSGSEQPIVDTGEAQDAPFNFTITTGPKTFDMAGKVEFECEASFTPVAYTDTGCKTKVTVVRIENPETMLIFAKEGDDAPLPCTMETHVATTWKKDNAVICDIQNAVDKCANKTAHEIDVPAIHDLKVLKVVGDSAGNYTCGVTNPPETVTRQLIVVKDPVCTDTEDGTGFLCTVQYKGNKEPTLTWTEEEKEQTSIKPIAGDTVDGWKSVEKDVKDITLGTKYTCKVGDNVASCDRLRNSAAGLEAGFYKSLLLSLAFMCLWCKLY